MVARAVTKPCGAPDGLSAWRETPPMSNAPQRPSSNRPRVSCRDFFRGKGIARLLPPPVAPGRAPGESPEIPEPGAPVTLGPGTNAGAPAAHEPWRVRVKVGVALIFVHKKAPEKPWRGSVFSRRGLVGNVEGSLDSQKLSHFESETPVFACQSVPGTNLRRLDAF
jgi:hypothetical protein